MFSRVSAFLPASVSRTFGRQLRYNNSPIDERELLGFLIVIGAALGLGVGVNAGAYFGVHPAIAFFAFFLGTPFVAYLLLRMSSESKGKFVETVLPDALQLIASNMKSGLTTERALFVAGRQEFGPLELELKTASKRISAGERVDVALFGISEGVNSNVLKKTIWLISQGIQSGGQIADLLLQLADDLKSQQALEDETKANISIYVMLIFFAALFGTPVLFGISSFIVQILTKQLASVPHIELGNVPGSSGLGPIKAFASGERNQLGATFIFDFSIVTLMLTTLFSALTIGVIEGGKEINGVKYIIPLLLGAFLIFFVVRAVLNMVFWNLA